MKDEEKTPSQVGLYNLPKKGSNAGNKVSKVFNTLKRRADQMETSSPSSQVTPLRDHFDKLERVYVERFQLRY